MSEVLDRADVALDKVAIAALRQADRICFHHYDGKSFITAIKKVQRTARDPFAPDEVTVKVPCKARITDYERGTFGFSVWPDDMQQYQCFEMLAYPSEDGGCWQTIAGLLKPVDELIVHWVRGGMGCPNVRDHGLVGDMLELIVQRDRKRMTFLIYTQVGEDNTARMCRRHGYGLT